MISIYMDLVRDALYPKKKGVLSRRNKFIGISSVAEMSADDIKELRLRLHLSSSLFADLLGVSAKTVESWEAGTNKPHGCALRLMNMISKYPDILIETNTVIEKSVR